MVRLPSSCQNSASLDTCSTVFEIWSAMAFAAFKCVNSTCRAVSPCFFFYLPVAMLTLIVQEFFVQTDSMTEKVESGNFLFS